MGNITGGDWTTSAFVKAKKWDWILGTSFYRTERSWGPAPRVPSGSDLPAQ